MPGKEKHVFISHAVRDNAGGRRILVWPAASRKLGVRLILPILLLVPAAPVVALDPASKPAPVGPPPFRVVRIEKAVLSPAKSDTWSLSKLDDFFPKITMTYWKDGDAVLSDCFFQVVYISTSKTVTLSHNSSFSPSPYTIPAGEFERTLSFSLDDRAPSVQDLRAQISCKDYKTDLWPITLGE